MANLSLTNSPARPNAERGAARRQICLRQICHGCYRVLPRKVRAEPPFRPLLTTVVDLRFELLYRSAARAEPLYSYAALLEVLGGLEAQTDRRRNAYGLIVGDVMLRTCAALRDERRAPTDLEPLHAAHRALVRAWKPALVDDEFVKDEFVDALLRAGRGRAAPPPGARRRCRPVPRVCPDVPHACRGCGLRPARRP